jgi:hypothetical protein
MPEMSMKEADKIRDRIDVGEQQAAYEASFDWVARGYVDPRISFEAGAAWHRTRGETVRELIVEVDRLKAQAARYEKDIRTLNARTGKVIAARNAFVAGGQNSIYAKYVRARLCPKGCGDTISEQMGEDGPFCVCAECCFTAMGLDEAERRIGHNVKI